MSEAISWRGYAYDVPSGPRPEQGRHAAELDLRRLLYARVLSQLGRRSATGDGELVLEGWRASLGPWSGESEPEYLRPVCGALFGARFCGQGAGLHRECESAHGYWTPLGCGSPWCLRCSGVAADARSSRVHRDIRAVADTCAMITGKRPPVVRIVLTLSDKARPGVIGSGRLGASEMLRHAKLCIRRAAGSDGTLPLMLTLHPTSSSRPWLKRPHIEAFALWSDVGEDPRALAWAAPGRPLNADALRSSWSSLYHGSIELHASYYSYDTDRDRYVRPGRGRGQSLASGLRYALRGFNEDVWWAAAGRNLGVPGGSMVELLDPRRTPALRGSGSTPGEVVAGLEADGGVLMWKGFHRVRRSGALAARGFRARLAELRQAAGLGPVEWSVLCKCPECGERLVAQTYEDDEGRQRVVILRRSEADECRLELLPGLGRVVGVTA